MLASTEDETMTTQTQAQIRQAVAALAARLEDHFQRPTEIRKNPNGDSATAFILDPATHDAGLGLGVRVTSTGGLD